MADYVSYRGLPTYDPLICLAAIAGATKLIRLGTTVTPLPRRHPARQASLASDERRGNRWGIGSENRESHLLLQPA